MAGSAPLLAFLDADDVWLPHRLAHHVDRLQREPRAAMVYGQTERWFCGAEPFCEQPEAAWPAAGTSPRNFVPPLLPRGERYGLLSSPLPLPWFRENQSLTPCTCSVMVRRAAAEQVGNFEPLFKGLYDDQAFYAKIALRYRVLVDPVCVARYRQHPDSCCATAAQQHRAERERQQFLEWLQQQNAAYDDLVCVGSAVLA